MFGSNQLQKTLEGKVPNWLKKRDLFNCKYKVTLQPDECAEPTCAVTCLIHFGLGHQDNIQFLKCTFVMFYLFIYSFCL